MTVFGLIGALALWLTFAWLLSAIIASYLSDRKGYGERPGLASGLLLNAVGILIWLLIPAKEGSRWKRIGPWGRGGAGKNPPPARAEDTGGGEPPPATAA
jgi:MFS family permease